MKFLASRSLALIGSLVIAGSAHANLLTNGSFENGQYVDNNGGAGADRLEVGSTAITGWTVIGGSNIAWTNTPNSYRISANDGIKFLDLTGYQDNAPFGGVSQLLVNTMAGALYQLTFDLGSSDEYGRPVSILASAGDVSNALFSSSRTGTDIWERQTLNFAATSSNTTVSFLGNQGNFYIGLDNADVTLIRAADSTAVPEPGSLALALAGLGIAGVAARRRQN